MAKYNVNISKGTASSSVGVGAINAPASGMRRVKLYDFTGGFTGVPADAAGSFAFQRSTTAGTGTGTTPQAIDPADPAAVTVYNDALSANGTLTANAFVFGMACHQRNTIRWVAREGDEILIPATASNGIHILTPVAPAVAVFGMLRFEEQ